MNEAAIEQGAGAAAVDPYKIPFLKNWAWWTSLVAAVPAGFLGTWIVILSTQHGGQYNWVMAIAVFVTFICALGLTVLPLLMALGFMVGGKEVTVLADTDAGQDSGSESDFDGFEDDDGFDDDGFDDEDDDDLFE